MVSVEEGLALTIRRKTTLIIMSVLTALTASAMLFIGVQVLAEARKSDANGTSEKTSRAFIVFANMVSDLERAASDYAAWDDTCTFVADRNEDYIRANLIDETFSRNRFGFMVFLDAQGTPVFSAGYNLQTGRPMPTPAGLLSKPAPGNPLLRTGADKPLSGILVIPEGSFLISSCPILTSAFEGPSKGTLLIGRPLDTPALALLAQLTQLQPDLHLISDEQIPADVRGRLLSSTDVTPVEVKELDRETIAGYALIRDVFNHPALVLKVSGSRMHYQHAIQDLILLYILLIIVGAGAIAVSLTLINRLVLVRTTQLSDFVNQVSATGDLSTRLTLKGKDELSELGSAFNRMLDALQQDIVERKHAEENLRESEEIFRSIFEESPLGMITSDANYRFIRVNPAFCRMTGYSKEELSSMTFKDLSQPDQIAADVEAIQRVFRRESPLYRAEKQYIRKDGQMKWGAVTVSAIHDKHGQFLHFLAMIEDVDERRNSEEALRQQEAFLRSVIDVHPGFVFVKDRESRFLLANKTLCDMYGTTTDAVIGKSDADFNSNQEEVEHFHRDDIEVIDSKEPKHIPLEKITGVDGNIRWLTTFKLPLVAKDGSCSSLLGVTIDITDLKRAEEALSETEGKYRAVLETTSTGYVMLDEQGRVLDANEHYVRLTGHTSFDDIKDRSVVEWTAPQDRERNAGEVRRCLDQGRVLHLEMNYVDASGNMTPIEIDATCVNTREGRRILTLCRDITERKRNEEERKNLEAQMQQSQKLESLGVLAGGIAHDFNNLLMAVLGTADMALSSLPSGSPICETIEEIIKGARRAAELCKQMLAYSGKSQFVIEPQELSTIVREMTHMLEVSVSKKAILRYNFADNLPAVEADATQLRQVVMNLILNASEALSDKSGVIAVSTGARECGPSYLQECFLGEKLLPGLYVYLEVTDTGCGMDQKTVNRVFEPFFSTKFTGRGLGLTAVFGIVRGHRGALRVDSETGRGTTFRVLFPASTMGVVRKDHEPEAAEWQGSGTILVVDDEETVRTLGRKMVERSGFSTLTACDGREAVEVFRQNADKIICVLLDLTMPHMDGVEAFQELRKIRSDIRVILSSGYDEQEVSRRFAGAGMAGFIEKPYTRAMLIRVLRRVLESPDKR